MLRIVLISILALISSNSWSCSCFGQPTFCETIDTSWVEPDIIVLATKISDVYYGMQLVVDQAFAGDVEAGDTLMVWGDNGILCRIYAASWSNGTTAVFALHNTDMAGNWLLTTYPPNLEQPGDYHISACGVYNLGYANGMVNGPIAPGFNTMSLSDFVDMVDDCFITTGVEEHTTNLDFNVWSNGDQLIVELPMDRGNEFEMTLFNSEGRTVRSLKLISGRNEIMIGRLAIGVYLMRVSNGLSQGSKKIPLR